MAVESRGKDVKNVIGACIFVAYVLAALFLTACLTHHLFIKYTSLPVPRKESLATKIQTCAALSAISFSVLSYHMLNYLIQSYYDWALSHSLPVPNALWRSAFWSKSHIWTWLRTSTLFQNFAQTIVSNDERFWWTGQALLWTMGWSVFMSIEGRCFIVYHVKSLCQ